MLRYFLFYLIFYLGFLVLPMTLNEIDMRRKADHSNLPYKHFGRHYEYIYETPSTFDLNPRFQLSYGTIGGDTDTIGTIKQMHNAENHRREKHWQSNAEQMQSLDAEPENFQEKCFNASIRHVEDAWQENENARRRVQKEYEIVRQFADDIFNQAKEQMLKFPTFDIPRFQRVFSAITDTPVLLSEGFLAEKITNPRQYGRRRVMKNEKQNMKANNEVTENHGKDTVRKWSKNGSRNYASYQMFGTLPKFDPRFPFDRAYKLMEGLRPPEPFKFPLTSSNIEM